MTYETLNVEKQAGVGIITLNRPEKLNALNRALTGELNQVLDEFEQDSEVKAIIVTGSGERAFSAGADIHEMSQQSEAEMRERGAHGIDWTWRLANFKKPTIGAINGLAYGGGALMASLLDLRVGCERSSFRFLGVRYGRVNSTWTLPLIVGWPAAKDLLFTGRVLQAEEARGMGLLNRLVPSSELMKTALDIGQAIATNETNVVQTIKDILIRDIGMSWRDMMRNEIETVSHSLKVPPPAESFKDFLERRGK